MFPASGQRWNFLFPFVFERMYKVYIFAQELFYSSFLEEFMCVMTEKEFYSNNSMSVSERRIIEREYLKKHYQADLEEVFLHEYEDYRNDMLDDINVRRAKLVEMLSEPITFENYTIDGYDETFCELRSDLEALATLDAFFDAYLKGAIAHKTHINP